MIDYHEYFGVMLLPAEQIKKRIQTAEELEDEFFEFLSELKWANGSTVIERIKREFAEKLEQVVTGKTDLPMFAAEYSDKVTDAVYSYTMERAEAEKENGKDIHEEPLYVFSIDRAALLAAGAALAIWAYREYVDAYSDGYTTKTWVCMMDGKERDSHAMADGQTVGIDEYFTVGDCQMLYPCDYLNGDVSETANCRCWCEYGGKGAAYAYDSDIATLNLDRAGGTIDVRFDDRKITEWLLDPTKPHYEEFISVGYTIELADRLRQDIINTYRDDDVADRRTTIKGTSYSYLAKLGVDDKKTFKIVWAKDDGEVTPHFVTAYRNDGQ